MDLFLQYPVDEPFLLNGLKHHANYVKSIINKCINNGEYILSILPELFKSIGGSQMDFYTGDLAPDEVAGEIEKALRLSGKYSKFNYLSWIYDNKGFHRLKLSDNSIWVLMEGNMPERYIHIHPGRHSPQTIRLRAGTLKSAVAAIIWAGIFGKSPLSLKIVNEARMVLLNEPPVKNLNQHKGLGAIIKMLKLAE